MFVYLFLCLFVKIVQCVKIEWAFFVIIETTNVVTIIRVKNDFSNEKMVQCLHYFLLDDALWTLISVFHLWLQNYRVTQCSSINMEIDYDVIDNTQIIYSIIIFKLIFIYFFYYYLFIYLFIYLFCLFCHIFKCFTIIFSEILKLTILLPNMIFQLSVSFNLQGVYNHS